MRVLPLVVVGLASLANLPSARADSAPSFESATFFSPTPGSRDAPSNVAFFALDAEVDISLADASGAPVALTQACEPADGGHRLCVAEPEAPLPEGDYLWKPHALSKEAFALRVVPGADRSSPSITEVLASRDPLAGGVLTVRVRGSFEEGNFAIVRGARTDGLGEGVLGIGPRPGLVQLRDPSSLSETKCVTAELADMAGNRSPLREACAEGVDEGCSVAGAPGRSSGSAPGAGLLGLAMLASLAARGAGAMIRLASLAT